jgi:hypothetical protein
VIGILEFNYFLAGTGYPTGKNTRAGTGMGKILYPRVYMGNPTGRVFFDGYGYGMVLPNGYVPVAIPTPRPSPPSLLPLFPLSLALASLQAAEPLPPDAPCSLPSPVAAGRRRSTRPR